MTAQEVYITFTQHEGVHDSCDTWCNQIVFRLNLFLHNNTSILIKPLPSMQELGKIFCIYMHL